MLAIHELERAGPAEPRAVDAFLSDHGFPLVEGTTVTFTWRGKADEVHLRHWIYGLPSSQPFQRLGESDLWFLLMDLPEGSRVEYKIELVHGPDHRLIRDPLNPELAHDPYGANSVVRVGPNPDDGWTQPDPEARPGEIVQHRLQSDVFGGMRPIEVYRPARFHEHRRYPLLVVHDGSDYVHFASLKIVLDNLIHRLEIPPLIVAMTSSPNRLQEYADDEQHAQFLTQELVPLIEAKYPLVATPDSRALMGASFGAVASLAAAWRHPGFFGKLMLQSGSFAFTDIGDHDRGPAFDPIVDFVNAFRRSPGRPAERIYVTCGTYESLIYYNRSLVPLLQSTGLSVRYLEVRDGHNWENWRDRLREGLSWLFPGPLWMVYE